ncbi:MAG: hypothetical protein WCY64_02280 [Candidatus Cloacimonadaceae bacterium]
MVLKNVDGSPIPDSLESSLLDQGFDDMVFKIPDKDPLPKINNVLDKLAQDALISHP